MEEDGEIRLSVEDFCESIETKMRGGAFSVVVLFFIASSGSPVHGYMITKALTMRSNGALRIQAGTLYPILKNLEVNGLLTHEMVKSTEGPPRKTYSITDDGRRALERLLKSMDRLLGAIEVIRETDWTGPYEKRKTE